MKLQLSDIVKYDGRDVIWVFDNSMTVVTIRVPEDQKKEVNPCFILEKGLEGAMMRWEPRTKFYTMDDPQGAFEEWKKDIENKEIIVADEVPDPPNIELA